MQINSMMSLPQNRDPQAKLSSEFTTDILPDGTLRVIYRREWSWSSVWATLAAGLVCLSFSAFAAGFGSWRDPLQWLWYALMLVGAFLIYLSIHPRYAWTEWDVQPDLIEVKFFRWRRCARIRRHTTGKIIVERIEQGSPSSNSGVEYAWFLRIDPEPLKGIIAFDMIDCTRIDPRFAQMDALYSRLGELLAEHTGWELAPLP